ncbi:MAG TPA: Cd(II)/Pb(II)-responsive transcriptional regulator, partial [Burkholderiaceae bacterium]|nr:Cd(II)/Pb(II)-responsive transcriptional regulator [Burkholderiaceae bacterium]
DCEPVNHLLDEHIVHVDVRLQELQRLKEQLTALRRQCASAQSISECGIIHGLNAMATEDKHPSASHLG